VVLSQSDRKASVTLENRAFSSGDAELLTWLAPAGRIEATAPDMQHCGSASAEISRGRPLRHPEKGARAAPGVSRKDDQCDMKRTTSSGRLVNGIHP